jgi:hypothetical protein
MENLSIEQFKRCLPSNLKGNVTDSIVERFNEVLNDPIAREAIADNLLGFTNVISQGKFKLESYLYAVKYVTYKAMGDTNIQAYRKTFPQRVQDLIDKGTPDKDINSMVSAYNKSKLVTLLFEAMMIPTYILNQDVFQEAINVQRKLMLDPTVKPLVRCQAAKALMDTLKPPEVKQMELAVSVKETDTVTELRKATTELAKAQIDALRKGGSLEAILNSKIVQDVEYE